MSDPIPIKKEQSSFLSKERRFGTDGIRGPVDSTMNPLFVTQLGWAAGTVLLEEGITKVLIGKDTRISGYMLESALHRFYFIWDRRNTLGSFTYPWGFFS